MSLQVFNQIAEGLQEALETVRGDRMTDDALIERVMQLYWEKYQISDKWLASEALAAARPVIRAQALEEAAQVAEAHSWRVDDPGAAAIRALKEKA